MDQQPLLEMHLRSLRLPAMLANYRRLAGEVAEPMTYLTELTSLEVDKRHENGVRARVAAAHFPVIKTIESFDFSLQPQLPKAKVLEVFDCTFIDHRRNLICIGPSLIAAKRDNLLDRKLRSLNRYDILLIDELGYIPFEREATDLLFQIISQRYERSSIAITTNLAFSDWTNIFPDAMAATAVIDRLVHHGSVFEFAGDSQRLKARQRRSTNAPPGPK